ncbi:unnamed protein product [Symbiodinium sp. CCMP2592]|nr:unnamed protein product [Symbiodinium sp. CCMP2592]
MLARAFGRFTPEGRSLIADIWHAWPGDAVGAKRFADGFIWLGEQRRHISEFNVATSYELIYFDIASESFNFGPLHSYIFGGWAELPCITVTVRNHVFGKLYEVLHAVSDSLLEPHAMEGAPLEEWEPDSFLEAYVVLPLAFLKSVALDVRMPRRAYLEKVVSRMEACGPAFGYHRACSILLDGMLNPIAEEELQWEMDNGLFELPMKQATKVMKTKHVYERLMAQRVVDFEAGRSTRVEELSLSLYGDVRHGRADYGFDVLQDHFNRLVPVQNRVAFDLEERRFTEEAYLRLEYSEIKRLMIGAVAAAKHDDFVVLSELDGVAQDYVAQGRTKTERPQLSELLSEENPLADKKAEDFVKKAVAADDADIRPNRRAAMEIFGLVGPAMMALALGTQLGALIIEGGKNRELLPVDAFYDAVQGAAHYPVLGTWFKDPHLAAGYVGSAAFTDMARRINMFRKTWLDTGRRVFSAAGDHTDYNDYNATQSGSISDNFHQAMNDAEEELGIGNSDFVSDWPFSEEVKTRREVRKRYFMLMKHMSKHKVLHLTGDEAAEFKEQMALRKDELIAKALEFVFQITPLEYWMKGDDSSAHFTEPEALPKSICCDDAINCYDCVPGEAQKALSSVKAESETPGIKETGADWGLEISGANLQSVEPFEVRKERRREADKSVQKGAFVATKKGDPFVRMPAMLLVLVSEHVQQLSEVISGLRQKPMFGVDPLKALLGAVRASGLPDTEHLLEAGKAFKKAGRLVGSSPFRVLIIAAEMLGSKVAGQAEEAASVLEDSTCMKLIQQGVAFDELPMPGFPEEILAMMQEAARAAVFAVAVDEDVSSEQQAHGV